MSQGGRLGKKCDKRLRELVVGKVLQGSQVWPLGEKKRDVIRQALDEVPRITVPFHRRGN